MKKMNKRGVELGNAVFAIVIISMAIIAVGTLITSYEEGYNIGVTNDLDEYNKLDDASDSAQNQKESISPNDPDPSEDAEANTFRGGYGIITGTLSSLSLVFGSTGMIQSLSDRFDIPNYIIQGIITLIVISLVFSIIAVIFRLTRSKA